MKKIFKSLFIVTIFSFLMIGKVYAFDYSAVNISNKIHVPILQTEAGVVKIQLNKDLKDNNSTVYYQFIETTEATVNYYETESDRITSVFRTCDSNAKTTSNYESLRDAYLSLKESLGDGYAENQEYIDAYNAYVEAYNSYLTAYNACATAYNTSYSELMQIIPTFEDVNWQSSSMNSEDDTYAIYKFAVPENTNHYWLWVKAKDEEGTDIYQVIRRKGSSSYTDEPSSQTTEEPSSQIIVDPSSSEEPSSSSYVVDNPKTGHKSLLLGLPILLILFGLFAKYKFFEKSKISNI